MNDTLLSADLHLNHRAIILHALRKPWLIENPNYDSSKPFDFELNNPNDVNLEAHDTALIENWNKIVSKGDRVIIIGDFAWKNHLKYLMALRGKKILIKGNHDKASQEVYKNFTEVHEFGCVKEIDGYMVTLCHYALRTWSWDKKYDHKCISLHGHNHGRLQELDGVLSFDVGVDVFGYSPVPWNVIIKKIESIKETYQKQNIDINDDKLTPQQRMIFNRQRNRLIVESVGIKTYDAMWPDTTIQP
jgi:calcineurin-like phosphoesterase family protein